MKKPKALALFSGGLDSRLIIKLLLDQKLDVEAVYVKLPFGQGCCSNTSCVFNYSQVQGVKLHIIDATKGPLLEEYLSLIKHPKHGYGVFLNPCKDCKIFLLKKSKELMKEINADFLVTGEVVGQRPNSQYKSHLELIEKEADLEGKILRPLCAKLLPETIPEKNKWIDREKLLAIEGRQRKKQIELAKKYNIKFPLPGGGCLLCEKNYCRKLKELLNNKERKDQKIKSEEIIILKIGKHFRSTKTNGKIVLGRNQIQNNELEEINKTLKYNIIISDKIPGPTAIFEDINDKKLTIELIEAYSKKDENKIKEFQKLRV